jgi:hypothetical protein
LDADGGSERFGIIACNYREAMVMRKPEPGHKREQVFDVNGLTITLR